MTRVRRNADGMLGTAEQRAAPTTMRELVVDSLTPVGAEIGDFVIALDDGTWDAASSANFAVLYTAVS